MAAGHGGAWWATRGIQLPRAGRCHAKASGAFALSLSKEQSFLSLSLTYIALYRRLPKPKSSRLIKHSTESSSKRRGVGIFFLEAMRKEGLAGERDGTAKPKSDS